MNILIIGNGFDLAHQLPTTYSNFLDFIEQVIRMKSFPGSLYNFENGKGSEKYNKLDESVKEYIHNKLFNEAEHRKIVSAIVKNNEIFKELIELSDKNVWISWFKIAKIKKGWIDFEAEISNVVQRVESLIDYDIIDDKDEYIINIDSLPINDYEFINHFIQDKDKPILGGELKKIKNRMLNDLNGLIRCLEIYLEDCVRNIDKNKLSLDIYDLKIDKVLSFNYTDTYNRLYSVKHRSVECDYIHGKSKISSDDPNNMVLGIDEYLSNEDKFTKLEFIEFKKHFQRIHKSTDCSYRKWLEEITNSKNKKSNAYFFGHSLALTDKDVILDFINNENIVTTIFYRNEKQYAELITNIVKIIGPDCLSEKVYGKTPSIIFKKQRDIIDRTHSEWEILNDRHLVWRIYTLNNKKIKELIERIRTKISVEDLTYFYNQRNVINLYHAIISNIDIGDVSDTLFEIAKKLYDSKSCELFHWEDWSDIDYQGEIECNEAVRKFVEMVNEYNFEQHNTSTTVKITFDDLNLLLNQIKRYNFDNKKVERIFDSLINKFDDENADTRLVWECIHTLLRKMNEDSRTKLIKKKEKNMDQIMKIRMKHICDVLDEEAYYRARTDDMAQEQSLFV